MLGEIVLTKEQLGGELFKVMGDIIEILMKLDYVCKVCADEPDIGIYVIEYDYNNPKLARRQLVWIDEEKEYIGVYGTICHEKGEE